MWFKKLLKMAFEPVEICHHYLNCEIQLSITKMTKDSTCHFDVCSLSVLFIAC